ncbi:unnamed protein product (macronuclear) [Paramecium tetraurelia]|uniref:Ubiquitin-like domain-containing protein n=1 Tax=Paramecium tetraurelia TaxID=5888 RepID=A0D713_PARTE|nr:uncharacterized protein GSPATT00001871001 [Paramecium tetraurelia]CAK78830.1 unnamed protein product [Paramecium tetraurelia]|eukprot:XP_001446227.1 hypothetical protein (macronuclear) [Paramecium tetraurelia strain d4-2]
MRYVLKIEQQNIALLLDINNPSNVNHVYANNFTLIPNKFVGRGIKKTNQYTTKLSRIEWDLMQKQFWDSRKDCSEWAIIKKAILCDDECMKTLVLQILGEANLKVIGNSIQVLVQDKHIFQVPIFVINEPTFCSNNKFELNFETSMLKVIQKTIQVRVRSSKLPQDFEISTQSTSTIQEIKQIILSAAKETTCRLYLNGRELIDQNQLGNYSISSGTVYFNNYTIRQSKLFCDYIYIYLYF